MVGLEKTQRGYSPGQDSKLWPRPEHDRLNCSQRNVAITTFPLRGE